MSEVYKSIRAQKIRVKPMASFLDASGEELAYLSGIVFCLIFCISEELKPYTIDKNKVLEDYMRKGGDIDEFCFNYALGQGLIQKLYKQEYREAYYHELRNYLFKVLK